MTTATRNAFIYGMTESLSETAIAYSLTAARWGVLTYDFLTSPEAKATYRWVGQMTIALGQLAFWSVVWAYAKVSAWAEAEVQSCLYIEDYEVVNTTEPDPFSPAVNRDYPDMAQAVTAPVVTRTVKVPPAQPQQYSIRELKRLASEAKVRNYSTMSKAKLMEVLGLA